MNRFFGNKLAVGIAVVVAVTLSARADEGVEIKLADCPAAVQKTLREESRGGTIDSVSKESEEGKSWYQAEVTIDGKTFGINVAEDGTLHEFSMQADDHEIGLSDCPAAVQKTFRREAGEAKVRDVRRETRLGVTIYVSTIGSGGKMYDVKVAEDGTLTEKVLVIDEDEVALADCPVVVQQVIKTESRGGTIGEMTRSAGLNKRVYTTDVEINGKSYSLEVAEDGALLSKSLNARD